MVTDLIYEKLIKISTGQQIKNQWNSVTMLLSHAQKDHPLRNSNLVDEISCNNNRRDTVAEENYWKLLVIPLTVAYR